MVLQGLAQANSYVFSEFEDSEESPRGFFYIYAAVGSGPLGMTGRIWLESSSRIRHFSQGGCCYLMISFGIITSLIDINYYFPLPVLD